MPCDVVLSSKSWFELSNKLKKNERCYYSTKDRVFTTQVVSFNIPEGVFFFLQTPLSDLKAIGVFTSKIAIHLGNLRERFGE